MAFWSRDRTHESRLGAAHGRRFNDGAVELRLPACPRDHQRLTVRTKCIAYVPSSSLSMLPHAQAISV